MQSLDGKLLLSASDLVNFLGCRHATYLDRRNLADQVEIPERDDRERLSPSGICDASAILVDVYSSILSSMYSYIAFGPGPINRVT
jgi:hypothetical protein